MQTSKNKNGLYTKILQTAIKLFNKKGYASVSIRDISEAINISPGNFTYYFKKKSDLMKALFDLQYDEYKRLDLRPCDSLEDLNTIFKKIIKHQRKYAFYFRNYIEIPRTYPQLSKAQTSVFVEFLELFRDCLIQLKDQGIVREIADEDVYNNLSYAILSVAVLYKQQSSFNKEFLKNDLLHVIWGMLLPSFTQKGLDMYNSIFQ